MGLAEQASAARQLCEILTQLPCFEQSQRLGLYWASDGEIDLEPLFRAAWREGKQTFLPVITGPGVMEYRRHGAGESLQTNRYGIAEPRSGREGCATAELNLIIAPLVGFDREGHRLGMGGGYYDRALANGTGQPMVIGAAHSCQELESVPTASWDRPLQGVATENAYYEVVPN